MLSTIYMNTGSDIYSMTCDNPSAWKTKHVYRTNTKTLESLKYKNISRIALFILEALTTPFPSCPRKHRIYARQILPNPSSDLTELMSRLSFWRSNFLRHLNLGFNCLCHYLDGLHCIDGIYSDRRSSRPLALVFCHCHLWLETESCEFSTSNSLEV